MEKFLIKVNNYIDEESGTEIHDAIESENVQQHISYLNSNRERQQIQTAEKSHDLPGTSQQSQNAEIYDEDEISNELTQIKRKKYNPTFSENWTNMFPWVEEKNNESWCKACCIFLKGSAFHLKRHETSTIHKKKMNAKKTTPNVQNFLEESNINYKTYLQAKKAELKLATYICEHNLPFRLSDTLPELLADIFVDSNIAKEVKMKRKKATDIVTNILAPHVKETLIEELKSAKFSLILDESTDISTTKNLVLVVRYWQESFCTIRDRFLSLPEVKDSSAEGLFNLVKNIFDVHDIPYTNLIGFGADNAYVMMGNIKGLKSKLKNLSPNLVSIGCTCHSLHLCASYASKKLPDEVEQFARDIYNFFSNSSKKQIELNECQVFAEEKPTKILYPSQTRWLSLRAVVNRILDHWSSLTLFFQRAFLEDNLPAAENILLGLRNPIRKIYFNFLSHILEIIAKMNIEFQTETPKIPLLLEQMSSLYKTILKFFVKRSLIDRAVSLNEVNVNDPNNYIAIENVYFGAKTEIIIKNDMNIDKRELHNFRLRALEFYIELCRQIQKRFDFSDPYLLFASKLSPKNAVSGDILSISEFKSLFPYLEFDPDLVNTEWQLLSDCSELKKISNDDVMKFWHTVANSRNGLNEAMYPNLVKLIKVVLCLPHSSAVCERQFSALNLIKTSVRNRLNTITCEAVLHVKDQIKNGGFNFEKISKTKRSM